MYTLVLDYEERDFKILNYEELVAYRRFAIQDTADKTLEEALRYPEVQEQRMKLQQLVDLANLALVEWVDPMLPDPAALSQHEPDSQYRDSEDSAGLGAGPLEPEDELLMSKDERFNIEHASYA